MTAYQNASFSILAVDDERDFLDSIRRMLRLDGYDDVHLCAHPQDALALLDTRAEGFDVALLDITMPEIDGLAMLERIKAASPRTECIMITAHDSVPLVVEAIRRGAYDYLVKPLAPQTLRHALTRALERKRLLASLQLRTEQVLDHPEAFADLLTSSPAMLRVLHEAELHAASEIPVLVTGETGAGKELLAHAIHHTSLRKGGPFVAVNLLSIAPGLFESAFFGHAKGAFTGADSDRAGLLAQAEGGTLFLDEIGDLPMELQGKLLRVLQEGEYTPVGKLKPMSADIRCIAATHQDLSRLVKQHKFRKDLLYRLQFAHLHLPPLRERPDDIILLAEHFLGLSRRPNAILADNAIKALRSHHWPGNVRELKAVVEAAVNLAEDGVVEAQHLRLPTPQMRPVMPATDGVGLRTMAEVERQHILQTYDAMERNKTQTAKVLGIGLQTLHRKLKAYGVS